MTSSGAHRRRTQAERRQDAEEKLILAAVACIANKGVEGFNLADVARYAETSRSLVHHHFQNKEVLIDRAVDWLLDSPALAALLEPKTLGAPLMIEALQAYLSSLFVDPLETRALLIIERHALVEPRLALKLSLVDNRIIDTLEAHLDAGLKAGVVSGEVHAKTQAVLIHSGARAAAAAHLREPARTQPEIIVAHFIRSLRTALATGA